MCALSFCRSPISSSSLVIHYLGFLITSSSLNLAVFLHGIFLESPVVFLKFLERFIQDCLASLYLLVFFLASSTTQKQTVPSFVSITYL